MPFSAWVLPDFLEEKARNMQEKNTTKPVADEEINLFLRAVGASENPAQNLQKYMNLSMLYSAGIKEIKTKLEILDEEFRVRYDYNPIHHIESRLKSPRSMLEKIQRRGFEPSFEGLRAQMTDIAGVRVICNYIDDIYQIADMLLMQDDITLVRRSDYIKTPKPSGYRSLHLVLSVPIFLASGKQLVPVEVQIRTIAMDFWASLEHMLKYKLSGDITPHLSDRLASCAERIAALDAEMQDIQKEIEESFLLLTSDPPHVITHNNTNK